MHLHQPIDIAARLAVPILDQQARKLKLRTVQALPRNLQRHRLAAPQRAPVRQEIARLAVEMRFEHGQGGEEGIEGVERRVPGAEEVFEEMGGHARVQPEDARLPVVDEIRAALLDVGKGRANAGRDDEVARLRVRESGVRLEGMQRDDARVEEEG